MLFKPTSSPLPTGKIVQGFSGTCVRSPIFFQKRGASITPMNTDPASYDLVVVGTPVWAWSVSSPVRSYLAAYRGHLPDIAFFCTMGGRGSERAFEEMQAIAGKASRANYALTAREAASET